MLKLHQNHVFNTKLIKGPRPSGQCQVLPVVKGLPKRRSERWNKMDLQGLMGPEELVMELIHVPQLAPVEVVELKMQTVNIPEVKPKAKG